MKKLDIKDILNEHIYPKLDIPSLVSELSPCDKGGYFRAVCPECGTKNLRISKEDSHYMSCYKAGCYRSSLWTYVLNEQARGDKSRTLHILAENAKYNLDDSSSQFTKTEEMKKETVKLLSGVRYEVFEPSKAFEEIKISEYISIYNELRVDQKLKMVYSFVYRFSLNTNQSKKIEYYKNRKVSTNPYVEKIGFLTPEDIQELVQQLNKYFPQEDLIAFNLLNDKESKHPFKFKLYAKDGFCVVPSFDLYSNLITGFMFRNIGWQKYYVKDGKKFKNKAPKEFQICKADIVKPLPFALTYQALKDEKGVFVVTEGHPDGLSFPQTIKINNVVWNLYPIAIPGANGFRETFLGLLKNRQVFLALDQDDAGLISTFGYYSVRAKAKTETLSLKGKKRFKIHEFRLPLIDTGTKRLEKLLAFFKSHDIHGNIKKRKNGLFQKMQKAEVDVAVLRWNKRIGKDVNELKKRNQVKIVFQNIYK